MTLAAGFNSIFSPIRGSFWAPNQFLAQNEGRRGLQIGFWCNPRPIWGFRLHFGVKPGFPEAPSPLAGGYVYAVNNLFGIGQAAFVSAGV